jgi:signal transduction histidine kinase
LNHFAGLLENYKLLANILDQHYDAILFIDPQTLTCFYHNQPARILFNLDLNQDAPFAFETLFPDEMARQRFTGMVADQSGEHLLLDRFALKKAPDQVVMCGIKGKRLLIDGRSWLFCTFRDVSERIRMEERERAMQAQLIHANKMTSLGTMASGIAHEINNPNNFILSNAQIIADVWSDLIVLLEEEGGVDPDTVLGGLSYSEVMELVPKLLGGIIEGAGRINTIVSRMKQYSRPVQQENKDQVSLNRVVRFAVSMLEREIKKRTDRFETSLKEDLPEILGYEEQLEQVVINLIHNALQALPDRTGGVRVVTRQADGVIELAVTDDGIGISDGSKARIFEPFYTTKQERGGTGLGLYISYGIVREHGGDLIVQSRPGQGTTMTLRFPILPSEEVAI